MDFRSSSSSLSSFSGLSRGDLVEEIGDGLGSRLFGGENRELESPLYIIYSCVAVVVQSHNSEIPLCLLLWIAEDPVFLVYFALQCFGVALNFEFVDVVAADKQFPESQAEILLASRQFTEGSGQVFQLFCAPMKEHQCLKNRSLPRVVPSDDEIRTPQVLELHVFESAELPEFKGGNHGSVSGRLATHRAKVKLWLRSSAWISARMASRPGVPGAATRRCPRDPPPRSQRSTEGSPSLPASPASPTSVAPCVLRGETGVRASGASLFPLSACGFSLRCAGDSPCSLAGPSNAS